MLAGFRNFDQIAGGRGNIFSAYAAGVTPTVYTGTALTGPILYNNSQSGGGKGVTAFLLAVSYGVTVASTVAGAIGMAVGNQGTSAPGTNTAITLRGNLNPAGPTPQCTLYNTATLANAPTAFFPTGHVETGAITVATDDDNTVFLGGCIEIDAGGYYAAVASSATLTTSVVQVGLVWIEFPND